MFKKNKEETKKRNEQALLTLKNKPDEMHQIIKDSVLAPEKAKNSFIPPLRRKSDDNIPKNNFKSKPLLSGNETLHLIYGRRRRHLQQTNQEHEEMED